MKQRISRSEKISLIKPWIRVYNHVLAAIVSNRNTQQIAAGDVAAWNVLIAPRNGITAAAIFIVSEL